MLTPSKTVIFGVPVTSASLKQIPGIIFSQLNLKEKKTFYYVNAHCLNLTFRYPKYKKILSQASLVYSGGFGPILATKLLGRPLIERTPTPDFIDIIFRDSLKKKWSFYFVGTDQNSLKLAVIRLQNKFPGILISGYHHGFFSEKEESRLIDDINKKNPTFLIVGMGTPKQELWIEDNKSRINAKVFWAVGALFDVLSEKIPRAPMWMQRLELEWLFRLIREPRRLWRRYLIGNTVFIFHIINEYFNKSRLSKRR